MLPYGCGALGLSELLEQVSIDDVGVRFGVPGCDCAENEDPIRPVGAAGAEAILIYPCAGVETGTMNESSVELQATGKLALVISASVGAAQFIASELLASGSEYLSSSCTSDVS